MSNTTIIALWAQTPPTSQFALLMAITLWCVVQQMAMALSASIVVLTFTRRRLFTSCWLGKRT